MSYTIEEACDTLGVGVPDHVIVDGDLADDSVRCVVMACLTLGTIADIAVAQHGTKDALDHMMSAAHVRELVAEVLTQPRLMAHVRSMAAKLGEPDAPTLLRIVLALLRRSRHEDANNAELWPI